MLCSSLLVQTLAVKAVRFDRNASVEKRWMGEAGSASFVPPRLNLNINNIKYNKVALSEESETFKRKCAVVVHWASLLVYK